MMLYVCVVAGETIRVVQINTCSVVIPAPLSRVATVSVKRSTFEEKYRR